MNNNVKTVKHAFVLVLITLINHSSFAQENFIPGYIIKQNKDTVNGFIDYRNWAANPKEVRFKENKNNTAMIFSPLDILEFSVEDEIYVSGIVDTEVTLLDVNQLKAKSGLKIKVDTAFLQTIFKGKKELYSLKTKNGKWNFYVMRGGQFELLIYKKYLKQKDGKQLVVENKKFVGQLILYLGDCPSISATISSSEYTLRSMYDLFETYQACTSSETASFQKEKEKVSVDIGVLGGISMTSLSFTSSASAYNYLTDGEFDQSTDPSVGVSFDLIFPRNQGKWSINNELLYTTYSIKGSYEDYKNENEFKTYDYEIGYSYLKINTMMRYNHSIGKLSLILNAGLSNAFALSATNNLKTRTKFYSQDKTKESEAIKAVRNYEFGFVVGTGLRLKNSSFEIRAERANGMSDAPDLVVKTTRFYFLLGYKF